MGRHAYTVMWREVVSDGRAASYLVIDGTTPGSAPPRDSDPAPTSASPTTGDLALLIAREFFAGVTACSGGLFAASYREESLRDGRTPLVHDAALHPRGLPFLPLIRLGSPRFWQSHDHAVLAYPVAGGPLARRSSSLPRRLSAAPADPPLEHSSHLPGDPRSPGVWELGALAFDVLRFGRRVSLAVLVCDYPPRLLGSGESLSRDLLYRLTQSPIHRVLVARFLRGAAGRVAGMGDAGAIPVWSPPDQAVGEQQLGEA